MKSRLLSRLYLANTAFHIFGVLLKEAFWARGALVYVQTLGALLRAGDDIAAVLSEVEREAKAKRQADWRGRQQKVGR